MGPPDPDDLPRREFLRAAVAAGGASALAACVGEDESPSLPEGGDPDRLPERQHAWNDHLDRDDDGNVRPPEHHVLRSLSLATDPTDDARRQVETALRSLERAVEWSNDGLVFTLGYTPAYFDRFDESLPDSVGLPAPEALTSMENPDRLGLDTADAVLHFASDAAEAVLAAEEALFGEVDAVAGRELDATFEGVFERADRRTGFVGPGLPARKQDEGEVGGLPDADIPEDAPFWMGFRSGFAESQAPEDRVTIDEGPFAGGTTQHVESLRVQLRAWFDQDDHERRVALMFGPDIDPEDVGQVGEELGTATGAAAHADEVQADAREGVVGHAQKAARAREDGDPVLLRRDFNTTDGDYTGVHFLSLQREVSEFVRARRLMAGEDLDVGTDSNGILQYLTVQRRGNYLLPPREYRALPRPNPE